MFHGAKEAKSVTPRRNAPSRIEELVRQCENISYNESVNVVWTSYDKGYSDTRTARGRIFSYNRTASQVVVERSSGVIECIWLALVDRIDVIDGGKETAQTQSA